MKKLLLASVMASALGLFGQADSLKRTISLDVDFGAESRQLNTANMVRLGYDERLSDAVKSSILNDLEGGLNLGFQQSWQLAYQIEERDSGLARGVSIFHRNYSSLKVPGDAVRLMLTGNAAYAGETLDLSGSQFETWRYTALAYQYAFKWRDNFWKIEPGVLLAHEWSKYNLQSMKLYTEPEGRYVEVDGNYEIYETNANSGYAITGLGLIAGFEFKGRSRKSSWAIALEDFGFAYFTRLSRTALDSSFRFSGIELPTIESFGDSLLDARVDELSDGFFQAGSVYRMRVTPFRLSGKYRYQIDTAGFTALYLKTTYLHLPGYRIRAAIGTEYCFNSEHELQGELAYGGFNAFTLGVRYNWRVNTHLKIGVRASNLPAVLVPAYSGGTILSLSTTYTWP